MAQYDIDSHTWSSGMELTLSDASLPPTGSRKLNTSAVDSLEGPTPTEAPLGSPLRALSRLSVGLPGKRLYNLSPSWQGERPLFTLCGLGLAEEGSVRWLPFKQLELCSVDNLREFTEELKLEER